MFVCTSNTYYSKYNLKQNQTKVLILYYILFIIS